MIRKFLLVSVGLVVLGASAAYAFPPIDLTTAGATYMGADGVIWNQVISQPTGTGYIDPFLRVQANNVEEGFNTDFGSPFDPVGGHQPPLDDKSSIWTHNLVFGNLQTRNVGGIDYYVFRCDINEPDGKQSLLSLDELRLYTSATGSFDTYANMTAGSTLRYDMDAGGNDQDVYLDYALAAGSGQDDFEVLIPAAKFAGAAPTDFLYLYCKFGATGGDLGAQTNFDSGDGFEEWRTISGVPPRLPEPSTMLLLGGGLVGMLAARKRRK